MKRQINSRFSSRRRGRARLPLGNGEAGSLRWDGEPNSSLRVRQLSLRSARDSFLADLGQFSCISGAGIPHEGVVCLRVRIEQRWNSPSYLHKTSGVS